MFWLTMQGLPRYPDAQDDETDFGKVLKVNLTGAFNYDTISLETDDKRQEGAIINMSSVVGLMGKYRSSQLCSSKAGLIGFTKSVAREVANRNIRVICYCTWND